MENIIKCIFGGAMTGITYFLGGWDFALQTLIIAIVLDYITGVLKAGYEKQLNSKIGLKGIIKKVGYIIIVAVATLADSIVGDTGVIRTAVIYIFVANELLSVLENWAAMGLPCPKILLDKLEQLKNKNESEGK